MGIKCFDCFILPFSSLLLNRSDLIDVGIERIVARMQLDRDGSLHKGYESYAYKGQSIHTH